MIENLLPYWDSRVLERAVQPSARGVLNMQVSVFAVSFQAIGFQAMASVYDYFRQPK